MFISKVQEFDKIQGGGLTTHLCPDDVIQFRKHMLSYLVDSEWKWSDCSLPIKRHLQNTRSKEEYLFQIINCEDEGSHQNKVKILMDKSFTFEEGTGFIWHKSWNLPEIGLCLTEEEFEYLSSEYKEVRCQIMAVYPIKHGNSYYLNEVPLEGSCSKKITEPTATFKFLKFLETSFNHNRNKFCLMLWLYGENSYSDKDDILCLISSPIYVDSRKEARKKQTQTSQSLSQLQCPKKFSSPVGGAKGSVANSSEGFLNYYGAQNIRNKIKHPFYICYHFDRVFSIHQNKAVEGMDLVLSLEFIKSSAPLPGEQKALFLLVILETNDKLRKKIIAMLEKWKFSYIEFSHPDNFVAPKWVKIPREELKSAYRFYYQNQSIRDDEELFKREGGVVGKEEGKKQVVPSKEVKTQTKIMESFEHRTVINLSKPRKLVKLEYTYI